MGSGPLGSQLSIATLYPYTNRSDQVARLVVAARDPNTNDKRDPGCFWLNKSARKMFVLSGYLSGVPEWEEFIPTDPNYIHGDVVTTDATPTDIIIFEVGQVEAVTLTGRVAGVESAATGGVGGTFSISAYSDGSSLTLVGSPDVSCDAGGSLAGASFDVSVSGTDILVQVTGVSGKTVDWSADCGYTAAPV